MARTTRLLHVLLATAVVAGTAACAAPQAPAAPPPSCQAPPEAVLPHTAGALDETSSGAYCLALGDSMGVFLHSTDTARLRWAEIKSSDAGVLKAQQTGVLTAPVGVTPGIFGATAAGTATLSSTEPDGHTWTVTIVVS
jgi:hypothetical protein